MRSRSITINEEYMSNDDEDEQQSRAAWIRQRIKQFKEPPESADPAPPQNPRDFIHQHTPHPKVDQQRQKPEDGD